MRNMGSPGNMPVPIAPDAVYSFVLASSVGQAFDWPNSSGRTGSSGSRGSTGGPANRVVFSGDCNFFVDYASTAALVPAASITALAGGASSGVEMNPSARQIPPSTGGSIISPSSGIVTASFWWA